MCDQSSVLKVNDAENTLICDQQDEILNKKWLPHGDQQGIEEESSTSTSEELDPPLKSNAAPADPQNVMKEGYLMKCGSKFQNRWHRRFFRLLRPSTLAYAKGPHVSNIPFFSNGLYNIRQPL